MTKQVFVDSPENGVVLINKDVVTIQGINHFNAEYFVKGIYGAELLNSHFPHTNHEHDELFKVISTQDDFALVRFSTSLSSNTPYTRISTDVYDSTNPGVRALYIYLLNNKILRENCGAMSFDAMSAMHRIFYAGPRKDSEINDNVYQELKQNGLIELSSIVISLDGTREHRIFLTDKGMNLARTYWVNQ